MDDDAVLRHASVFDRFFDKGLLHTRSVLADKTLPDFSLRGEDALNVRRRRALLLLLLACGVASRGGRRRISFAIPIIVGVFRDICVAVHAGVMREYARACTLHPR
jgi:hypothetical protein